MILAPTAPPHGIMQSKNGNATSNDAPIARLTVSETYAAETTTIPPKTSDILFLVFVI
jgi:hypothetical protein